MLNKFKELFRYGRIGVDKAKPPIYLLLFLLLLIITMIAPSAVLPAAMQALSVNPLAGAGNPTPGIDYINSLDVRETNIPPLKEGDSQIDIVQMPVCFIPNRGQVDEDVRYYAAGSGYSFFLTPAGVTYAFSKLEEDEVQVDKSVPFELSSESFGESVESYALKIAFAGANPAVEIEGQRQKEAKVNYFVGSDESSWQTDIPTFEQVAYRGLYPGIDLTYQGNDGMLKYEFTVAPGADPSRIEMVYQGADSLEVDEAGNLLISTPWGTLNDQKPFVYQLVGERKVEISADFAVRGSSVGFIVGKFNRNLPLIIDPGLIYGAFLGGSRLTYGISVAVDDAGCAYITGVTYAADFPNTTGAYCRRHKGWPCDAFVAKLNPAGSALLYATFIGGEDNDFVNAIDVDSSGCAYITGWTDSGDFPTTVGAYCKGHKGDKDAFVAKLNPAGSALVYATYLGGRYEDRGRSIAVDSGGYANVTGMTSSTTFPTTVGAYCRTFQGEYDAFVAKLNPAGSGLVYSTYLGGNGYDQGYSIAMDSSGCAYISGGTCSPNFPTTAGAYCRAFKGGYVDVFVSKLNPAGTALVYSTYLGGSKSENGFAIALDSNGCAYVTGQTLSADFPTTAGAHCRSHHGGVYEDNFVVKFNPTGSALTYATYLGGGDGNLVESIAVDSNGCAYITGGTDSTVFPITTGAYCGIYKGGVDAFVAGLNPAGSALVYATYLGGSGNDYGYSIAMDYDGHAYVTGKTESSDFPTTSKAFSSGGYFGCFVTKLEIPTSGATPLALTLNLGENTIYRQGEDISIYLDREVVSGQLKYYLYLDEHYTIVRIDGTKILLKSITPVAGDKYLLKVVNPHSTGTHQISVEVVTNNMWVSGTLAYSAKQQGQGTLKTRTDVGTVDQNTRNWAYPTRYRAPVFRRGMDSPTFNYTAEGLSSEQYDAFVEIKAPEPGGSIHKPMVRVKLSPTGRAGAWQGSWRCVHPTGGNIPVGIYKAEGYLIRKGDPYSEKLCVGEDEFYVIFEYSQDQGINGDESIYTTQSKEWSYLFASNRIGMESTYVGPSTDLSLYDRNVWERAIKEISGCQSRTDAVGHPDIRRGLAFLARSINGKMVFHHVDIDEREKATIIGPPRKNWSRDYKYDADGKAYYVTPVLPFVSRVYYVDSSGRNVEPINACRIAYYTNVLEMLNKDFDPEGLYRNPYQQRSLGCCYDYAMLATAYFRSVGIKARVVSAFSSTGGGHGWLQWVDGLGHWRHFDADAYDRESDWLSIAFSGHLHAAMYQTFITRVSSDPKKWEKSSSYSSYSGPYSSPYSADSHSSLNDASNEDSVAPLLSYSFIDMPQFFPGESSNVRVEAVNPNVNDQTISLMLALVDSAAGCLPDNSMASPVAVNVLEMTVPAESTAECEIELVVDGCAEPGDDYELVLSEIIEDEMVPATSAEAHLLSKLDVQVEVPMLITEGEPFTISVTIGNNYVTPVNNILVKLGPLYDVESANPLTGEIEKTLPGGDHTLTWELTPVEHGELRIPVEVYSDNGGSWHREENLQVDRNPFIFVSAQKPNKMVTGEDFTITFELFNAGNETARGVTFMVDESPFCVPDLYNMNVGDIGPQEITPVTVNFTQNAADNFSVTARAGGMDVPPASTMVEVGIIRADCAIDLLAEGEEESFDPQIGVLELQAGKQYTFVANLLNSGDIVLTDIQIKMGMDPPVMAGDLEPGAQGQYQYTYTPTDPGLTQLLVTMTSDELERTYSREVLVLGGQITSNMSKQYFGLGRQVPLELTAISGLEGLIITDPRISIAVDGPEGYSEEFQQLLQPLEGGLPQDYTFYWDTAGLVKGSYTLTAALDLHGKEIAVVNYECNLIPLGDINGDEGINVSDAILVLRGIVGLIALEPHAEAAADVNGDGVINVADAILILRYIVGLIRQFQ